MLRPLSLCQSLPPAPQSSSPAPQGRSTVFPWPGAVMASLNVTTAVMRRTAQFAQPSSSSVIKEAVLMLRGDAMVNLTVLITLMSRTVKVGLGRRTCLTLEHTKAARYEMSLSAASCSYT